MSTEALAHVWNAEGLTAEEKLVLLWFANATSQLGMPVSPEWFGMAEFGCYHWEEGPKHCQGLIEKGFLRAGEESSFFVVYGGVYTEDPDWDEPRKVRARVAALIQRDGSHCTYCRKTFPHYHVDHVIPRSRGGPDVLDNLVLACPPCNMAKGARTPEEWLGPNWRRRKL